MDRQPFGKLTGHFSSTSPDAALDSARDIKERAKYSGLEKVLTSLSSVTNLRVMYDALTELSNLSRMLQGRETTLPEPEKHLARQIRVFESMMSNPGPHTQEVMQAEREKSFQSVPLREHGKTVKINAGQFFRSLADNLSSRMSTATSSHVSQQSTQRECKLIADMRVLQPDNWSEEDMNIQHGDAEVLR